MKLQCNIDRSGRAVRIGLGASLLVGAIVLLVVWWTGKVGGWWIWLAFAGLLSSGAFAIFEGAKGWCAVRAMGIRTWI